MKSKRKNKSSIVGGVVGALVGIGAAVTGGLFLKDKKNRDKVKKVIATTESKVKSYAKKINKKTTGKKANTRK